MWSHICGKVPKLSVKWLKKIKLKKIWTSRGYVLVVTQFVTQFTHVFRHPRISSRKQKNSFRENCLKNVVSDL